jgi:aconitate hydratase
LTRTKASWLKELVDSFGKKAPAETVNVSRWADEGGNTKGSADNANGKTGDAGCDGVAVTMKGKAFAMHHGDVVIAAITSCTNTSNPDVMIAAGLVARKARVLGLTARPWVKTSLAPGSTVVTEYYNKGGLTADLEALGFHTVGYGCTTCIGNSGPLPDEIDAAVKSGDLVVASVLSGNRNFEGRVHPAVKANYLASPPLVVAYAIAGNIGIDLTTEPIGKSKDGRDVFLKDIWPTHAEVQSLKKQCVTADQFRAQYGQVFTGNKTWNAVPVSKSELYGWSEKSTYIQNPPYFEGMGAKPSGVQPIRGARCLVFVGDSVTTDHISPAGDIAEKSPAGQYLLSLGVPRSQFNSYGSRRGNDRVMTRGTFANVRVKNKLADEGGKIREGWWTRDFSSKGDGKTIVPIFDAAMNYKAQKTPLVVLAGKDYGMGSSRDWAAKGAMLLGVKAVISESFERIHRSNLVGMGVLPLCFKAGETAASLGLDGTETFDVMLPSPLGPRCAVRVKATRGDGRVIEFETLCRIDTPVEVTYYENGGILQTVLRKMLGETGKVKG